MSRVIYKTISKNNLKTLAVICFKSDRAACIRLSENGRIMVVDDEPDILVVFKKALETNGFAVDASIKPEEALSHFKPDFYAMIITDIRMPVMNGFELYRQVKKIDDKIEIAFMTAFEVYDDEFRKVFTNIDVKCFIKKPVSPSDLVTQVKEELADGITFAS